VFRWRETGVAIEAPPARTGFGSKMIRACVSHELNGQSQAHWHADGLEYDVTFPLGEGANP
jgi:two-component sensor histidine kinase